jgi:heme/copper-type cytochrome/quinol oxidase subunit 4
MNIRAFNSFLKIVLKNNYFKFKDFYFLLIIGIAMVYVALLLLIFLFIYMNLNGPLAYYRFIDDVLVLVKIV